MKYSPADSILILSHMIGTDIKKACGIESGSAKPNRDKVAKITKAQVEEIAKVKMPDLNAASI